MISIIVKRGLGDKPGPDIVDPLLTTELVALARGIAQIDHDFSNRAIVPTTGPYTGYLTPGTLHQVTEEEGSYKGVIHRCAISFILSETGEFQATTSLEIEKEAL